ncbi:hypothetical protein FBY30_0268 [Arthrobacter sp. SLBN-83]|nr:hypothetical protein FBY30_0268 [Arthrobacter sp. SLBN-83]
MTCGVIAYDSAVFYRINGDQLNKLLSVVAVATAVTLSGCGGASPDAGGASASATAKAVFTVKQTCDQLFDKGDEGRMFGAVAFLTNLPDPVTKSDQTKAKIFASDLEYVADTANDELKPLILDMAKTLSDFGTAETTKVSIDADPFKAAGTKIINACPAQAEAYGDEKNKKEAAKKAAADAAAKKTADEAAAKAAAEAAAAPKEYSGVGDDVLNITKHSTGPEVAFIQHTGRSNFAVHTLDAKLESTDLLVNEIGNYSGTVLFDGSSRNGETTAFKITADGAWTVKLVSLKSVRKLDGTTPMTGTGDDVLVYTGPAKAAVFTHDGSSNIAVHSYGSRADLLVNEIGPYSGTVVWAPGVYTITADGNWSATLK